MSKPVKCATCGRENEPTFAFCLDCGQPMRPPTPAPVSTRCTGCGATLQPGYKFCGHCGRAAGAPPRPAGAAAPPPLKTALDVTVVAAAPRLCAVRHDGLPGIVLPLEREETLCGRTEGELRLAEDPTVSPRHARFVRHGPAVRVEDLGSVNGTYLRLKGAHRLAIGEELRIGRQLLRLEPLSRPAGQDDRAGRPWGAPGRGATLRLVQLLEGGGVGEIFPLLPGENLVGRDQGAITFPADRYVSGRHALVIVEPSAVTVRDLGSSNGTFVKVTGSADLVAGDQLLLGAQLFRLDA